MSKIWRKYGILIVSLFFMMVIGVVIMLMVGSISTYKKDISKLEGQVVALDTSLGNIGELQTGYVTTASVRAGEKITEDLIQAVDVPVKLGLNVATSADELIDKRFRVGLTEGTVLTKDTVVDNKIDNTSRYMDLVLDETPIGLNIGDFVDIRIVFPFGEDFVAMSHKRIEDINSGILKVIVTEDDISTYNSMYADKVLYRGSKIYAVTYTDPGAQTVAQVFYPLNKNISELTALNPNILNLVGQEMILKRQSMDAIIGGGVDKKTEEELNRITQEIEQTRNQMGQTARQAQMVLEQRLERERQLAAQANQ